MLADACRLLASDNYRAAGTVEFLVDKHGKHYFMEVNPRVQVEHTVTEEITGIDVVQSTMKLAAGMSLEELGLTQEDIPDPMGYAMQCRVTTENPAQVRRPARRPKRAISPSRSHPLLHARMLAPLTGLRSRHWHH